VAFEIFLSFSSRCQNQSAPYCLPISGPPRTDVVELEGIEPTSRQATALVIAISKAKVKGCKIPEKDIKKHELLVRILVDKKNNIFIFL
jgi:hypothetical protein